MRIEPKIFLIGESRINREGLTALLQHLGAPEWDSDAPSDIELLSEVYGRSCYLSFGKDLNPNITRVRKTNQSYISNIIEKADLSVLEHGMVNFFFGDVSRVFTAELCRHRVGTAICLTGDTLISSEEYANGYINKVPKHRLDYLYSLTETPQGRSKIPLLRLRVLNESTGEFTSNRQGVKSFLYTGKHPVFEVELANGYKCKMTKNHQFLTNTGWKTLENAVQFLDVWPSGKAYYGLSPVSVATNGYVVPQTAIPRRARTVKPVYSKIVGIKYCGIEDTYDVVMNDPHHNFVANGFVVHNSEASLRFIRLTDLNWYAPICIQENEQAMTIFGKTFEELSNLQKEMADMFELDSNISFEEKKKITSAMRRVAPLGLATNIGWSTNMRNLRHVIEMRTSPWAEEEIRLVFGKVANLASERWPNIFRDYEVKIVDGLPWYQTENKKM